MTSHTSQGSQGYGDWPPTQVRLQLATNEEDNGFEDEMNQDPLSYFLSPTPLLQRDDGDYVYDHGTDLEMDFDAGIEDTAHPPMIVRSVSPSSLDGLSLPPARAPTPPRSPPYRLSPDPDSASATDEDDDDEDYVRFGTARPREIGFPFPDFLSAKARKAAAKSKAEAFQTSLLAPTSSPLSTSPSNRGRSTTHFAPGYTGSHHSSRGRAKHTAPRRLSPHAWREPSPDVWSISEETEEEVLSSSLVVGGSFEAEDAAAPQRRREERKELVRGTTYPVDGRAAKPKKRVRFVLPTVADYM